MRDSEERVRGLEEQMREKKKSVPKGRGASEDPRETKHTAEDNESDGANF